MGKQIELPQGTLDMLILKAVSLGPLRGYGVLLRIQQVSDEPLQIQRGSLYPALYRLEPQGLICSEWGESDNNRKAKFHQLTAAGRRQLHSETETWNRMPCPTPFLVEVLGKTRPARNRYGRGTTLPYRELFRGPGSQRRSSGGSDATGAD